MAFVVLLHFVFWIDLELKGEQDENAKRPETDPP